MNRKKQTALSCVSLIALASAFHGTPAMAQNSAATPIMVMVQAQPLEMALNKLAQQLGKQIVISTKDAEGIQAKSIEGVYSDQEALAILLAGTGLDYKYINDHTIAIVGTDSEGEENFQKISYDDGEDYEANLAAYEDDTAQPEDMLEEVVITGSRIRRSNLNAAIPVQSFDLQDINASGTVDIAEMLIQIPGVGYDLSPESTGLSTQNPGLSTISLRGLGADRTLTLINGRRAISNSGNGERVSLNTIPSGFVRRLEVTTGGASAIYGADAIAGVVNILLRDDFDGIKAGYRYSMADASGEVENTIDLTLGTNFSDGRGNIMLGFTYDNETAIFADSSRPDSIRAESFIGGEEVFGTHLSSFIPGGRFEGDDAWNAGGVWFNDRSLAPDDGRVPSVGYETHLDGFNLRPGRSLSPASEVIAGAVKGHYDLTDDVTLFAETYFTRVNSTTTNAPRTASSGTDIGPAGDSVDIGRMASSHPFIPPAVEETRVGTVSWARRFTELGLDIKENQRDTLRTALGLKGSFDNGWDWTGYATYGRFTQDQIQLNALNYQSVQNALDIEDDGNGGYQCEDEGARAAGCVPLNLFGEGSITPAMVDYIRYTGHLKQERDQYTVAGNINGDIYDLPAGAVKAVVGFEYRKESQVTVGDPDNILEETSVAVIPDIDASFDVIEGFVEVDIPIVADTAGFHDLSLQLAARAGDYSTIGTIFSYNIGGSWSPTPDFRLRAQFSRSQRAPNITDFFSEKRGNFTSFSDPCYGLNPDGSGLDVSDPHVAAYTANCLSEVGVQAFFADPDNAGLPFDALDGSLFAPNAGNNQLAEETAETFTVGLVIAPTALPNFSFILDYYRIKVDGAIGLIATQDTVDLCYSAADFPNNRFCDVITRDSSNGEVVEVINRVQNLTSRLVEGIDVTLDYKLETEAIPGDLDLKVIYNHTYKNQQEFEGLNGTELTVFNGQIKTPKDQFRANLAWNLDNLRMSYTWRYHGGGVDDIDILPADEDYFKVDSQSYHDVYVRYKLDDAYGAEIYGGVRNLLNDFGPFLPTGLDNGSSRNITSIINSTAGREFYAGIRVSF